MNEREPVGTLAEEAARLLAAVQAWAGDSRSASGKAPAAADTPETDETDATEETDETDRIDEHDEHDEHEEHDEHDEHHEHHEHHEHASEECQWCPLCRLVRMARATSPEVRTHLSQAALSLALAVRGMLDDPTTTPRRETPLEKIDLTEE